MIEIDKPLPYAWRWQILRNLKDWNFNNGNLKDGNPKDRNLKDWNLKDGNLKDGNLKVVTQGTILTYSWLRGRPGDGIYSGISLVSCRHLHRSGSRNPAILNNKLYLCIYLISTLRYHYITGNSPIE